MGTEYQVIGPRISESLGMGRPVRLRLVPKPRAASSEPSPEVRQIIESFHPIAWMILESRVELGDSSVTSAERTALAWYMAQRR